MGTDATARRTAAPARSTVSRRALSAGLSLALGLGLAACGETPVEAPSLFAEKPPEGRWSLAPEGDVAAFLDCLEAHDASVVSAHRGGPGPGLPENAIETFLATLETAPALIEMDVRRSRDGVLFLMHDDTLGRTSTGEGPTEDADWATISTLKLKDPDGNPTDFAPPTFEDALAALKGRSLVQIDIKRRTPFQAVAETLNAQGMAAHAILIAYSVSEARVFHALAPEATISVRLSQDKVVERVVAAGTPADRIAAFVGLSEPRAELVAGLDAKDIESIVGTLGGDLSLDRRYAETGDRGYADLSKLGVDVIATDRPAAAHRALDAAGRALEDGECGARFEPRNES